MFESFVERLMATFCIAHGLYSLEYSQRLLKMWCISKQLLIYQTFCCFHYSLSGTPPPAEFSTNQTIFIEYDRLTCTSPLAGVTLKLTIPGEVVYSSYVNMKPRMSGKYATCTASNSLGSNSVQLGPLVVYCK